MKKLIVTGITGFVGTSLQNYLKDDYHINGVSREQRPKKDIYNYQQVTKEMLDDFHALIHLAGKAHDLKKVQDESSYFEANTELTIRLFDQFLESSCNTFVFMSSVKAVSDGIHGEILTELDQPNPKTVYGKSKLEAEKYILSKELPNSKKVYILRPCMIHGPENKGNLNLLYGVINKGIPYPMGAFQNKRSFLSVDNLCFVIKELINGNVKSGIYNIADDEPLSTNELIRIIGQGVGKKAKIISVPKPFINIIAGLGDLLSLPLNKERLKKLTENYVVSNEKIKLAIGKDFPSTSREGLLRTIQSFKND